MVGRHIVVAAVAAIVGALLTVPPTSGYAASGELAQPGSTFTQWGAETQAKIEQDFRVPGSNLYYENSSRNAYAFNWPQGIEFHAMVASGNLAQAQAMADEIHSRYWCFYNNRWGYNSTLGACGDRYYDDNAWIAKGMMELYALNNNVANRNRAVEIMKFVMSGENTVSDPGTIRWHEPDTSGTCVCATAPAIVANLMLYQATGTAQYLTDGRRLYNALKSKGFGYGPGHRGYEVAVITQGAMRLYRITGDATFLNDAEHLGLAMEASYIDWTTHALHETGQWGGHDMTAAFTELYQLDGDVYWLNVVAGYLGYLHDNLKDGNGRYPQDWGAPRGTTGDAALLYQSSVARAFFTMGTTPGGTAKLPEPVGVFRDCDHGGSHPGLTVGRYTTADLVFRGGNDNDVSSVKVQPGYRVTFYDGDNFTGSTLVKTADDSCLADDGWNDRAGSIVVEAVTPTVTVYKHCDFAGPRAVDLPVGDYTLAQLKARGINDNDISSMRVAPGYQVTAYDGDNLTGTSITLTADNPCLVQNNFNDLTTSVRVRAT
ncbi:peptidase inhibitor family I36 protein [Actinoplanes sp. NPDC049265]|uniref:peptidase inhibitor family I36 protein n=1 Tax=Actinoplanes sp. NPDC049265 TaxID=3363902 RepID=UPI00371E53AB